MTQKKESIKTLSRAAPVKLQNTEQDTSIEVQRSLINKVESEEKQFESGAHYSSAATKKIIKISKKHPKNQKNPALAYEVGDDESEFTVKYSDLKSEQKLHRVAFLWQKAFKRGNLLSKIQQAFNHKHQQAKENGQTNNLHEPAKFVLHE